MENDIHHDWCRLSGDDTGYDRGHGESLLVRRIDGGYRGQPSVSLQQYIPGVVTAGGYATMDLTADKTATNYWREVPAEGGADMIFGTTYTVTFVCISVDASL